MGTIVDPFWHTGHPQIPSGPCFDLGSAQMVEGHPALRQQIGRLTMAAAEELLVRQHAGSVPQKPGS